MGILYDDDEDGTQDSDLNTNTVLCNAPLPIERAAPMFVVRPGRRSRQRRGTRRTLPLYLSFTDLSDDAYIARLLSPASHMPTIQHRSITPPSSDIDIDIPQSLPATPASSSSSFLNGLAHLFDNNNDNNPVHLDSGEDWTFINTTTHHPTDSSTPSSEPGTWILCDDS